MHEKKILKAYGGISKKYHREMAVISYGAISLKMALAEVLKELECDDSDRGAILSRWMNGPYLILPQFESLMSNFESKLNSDSEFSDKSKREFMRDLIEPIKDDIRKTRELDGYIMNGIVPPSMRKK